MATDAQIAANRQNAKKSTGPRTPEGKRRSSVNALTFGLFSNDIREHFSIEDRTRYDDFIKLHTDAFSPIGLEEEWLAKRIAQTMFLLDRAHDLNMRLICEPLNLEGQPRIGYVSAEPLPNMALYKNRMRSSFERYCAQLNAMQARRKRLERYADAVILNLLLARSRSKNCR